MGSTISSDLLSATQIPVEVLNTAGIGDFLWPPQATLQDNATYDYIVVGGGSAGCVVSRRLAESKSDSVLVLEAGGNPPLAAMIFSLFVLFPHSFVDYDYVSTRDEYAARGQDNFTMITAGKMLGGSDSLNHFVHTRGIPKDYNNWAKMVGDESWRYENILKYFVKSERLDDAEILRKYGEFHGTDGPMGISRQPEQEVVNILKAFAEVGNPTVLDLNANKTVGYSQSQFMYDNYKRQTPAYSYLTPIKDYANLHVSTNTMVTRIIFEGNAAVGVEAINDGKRYTFRANKEIIMSAGVFNTPKLLMLSGIGPKDHLESFNIEVLQDLPVGENLIDHVAVTVLHKLKQYIPVPNVPKAAVNFLRVPFPVLTSLVALNKSRTCPNYQTFNLFFQHDVPFVTPTCNTVFGLRNEICDRWQKEVISRDSLYSLLTLLQPKSRGVVRLSDTDPSADPIITTGYYTKSDDLENMVTNVKDYITVGESSYFQQIGAEIAGLDLPACAEFEQGSDDFWKCYVLEHTTSTYHFVGTSAMGQVVDSKLRVKGLEGIRVVDASVMPNIVHGAPNAAVIMLAEKASDMIKNDNNN
ncbi:hypothetical protein PYW08_010299 [Mythimna loreyi]|uniref:Uncharacterized protein n=1 Tax=Mythimna loreyi TaxID=667449 RepID=A0ACC2Q609_9NEOP|nr:hypothetical protein PYW08_010299 [Mythimna loreyi]